jgi:hypothetical protein
MPRMSEYTVAVETASGASSDDEVVMAVHDALNSDPIALGPSISCHMPTSTITATFQVDADSMDVATDAAILAFRRALEAAGIDTGWSVAEVSPA